MGRPFLPAPDAKVIMLPLEDGPLFDACVRARALTGATYASALQRRGDELVPVASDGLGLGPVQLPLDSTRSAAARSLALRVPVFIPETRRASDIAHGMAHATGARSLLCAPMLERDRAVGVLLVGWRSPPAELSPGLIAELRMLARDIAWALPPYGSDREHVRTRSEAPATDLSAARPLSGRRRRSGRAELRSPD